MKVFFVFAAMTTDTSHNKYLENKMIRDTCLHKSLYANIAIHSHRSQAGLQARPLNPNE
jgi:hypothetical protein